MNLLFITLGDGYRQYFTEIGLWVEGLHLRTFRGHLGPCGEEDNNAVALSISFNSLLLPCQLRPCLGQYRSLGACKRQSHDLTRFWCLLKSYFCCVCCPVSLLEVTLSSQASDVCS